MLPHFTNRLFPHESGLVSELSHSDASVEPANGHAEAGRHMVHGVIFGIAVDKLID